MVFFQSSTLILIANDGCFSKEHEYIDKFNIYVSGII
jgi:hypothetical protein